jgi:dihydrodipicolinate synthase/N-acetylneuraminate lyase
MSKIQGVIVPLLSADKENLKRLLEHVSDVDFIFVLGTTGAFSKKTDAEKDEIVKTALENSKKPVLVGCADVTADKVIENIKKFAAARAAVVAPNPSEDVSEYFDKILENTDSDIVLYNNANNPAIGQNLPFEVTARLSKHERGIGVKDSSTDMDLFKKLLALKDDGFCVLQGDEGSVVESMKLGADGIVPCTANIEPQLLIDIFNKKEPALQEQLNELRKMYKEEGGFISALNRELTKKGVLQ